MPAAGEETVTEEEFEDGASNTDAPIVDTPSTTESETIQEQVYQKFLLTLNSATAPSLVVVSTLRVSGKATASDA